jgi:hypothetical protein
MLPSLPFRTRLDLNIVRPLASKPTEQVRKLTAGELSAHMRSLVEIRWKRYAERVARGEITAENYVYRPRGPMPPEVKAKQDMTRWEHQIANAQLVRFALQGRKLTPREVEQLAAKTTGVKRRRRPHLRFGGEPPKQWHSVHYSRSSTMP